MAEEQLWHDIFNCSEDTQSLVAVLERFFFGAAHGRRQLIDGYSDAVDALVDLQGLLRDQPFDSSPAWNYFMRSRSSAVSDFGLTSTSFHGLTTQLARDILFQVWKACKMPFGVPERDWMRKIPPETVVAASHRLTFCGQWGATAPTKVGGLYRYLDVEVDQAFALAGFGVDFVPNDAEMPKIAVNEAQRSVHRFDRTAELGKSDSGWHIFYKCWKAGGSYAKEAVRNAYPGEWSGIHKAISDLNAKLSPLKIRIRNYRLTDISKTNLTNL